MIYGNKFLYINHENSSSVLSVDFDNISRISIDEGAGFQNFINKVFGAIADLFKKFINFVDHVIDIVRVKMFSLKNKIIKRLDTKYNGEFDYDDLYTEYIDGIKVMTPSSESSESSKYGISMSHEAYENDSRYEYLCYVPLPKYFKIDNINKESIDNFEKCISIIENTMHNLTEESINNARNEIKDITDKDSSDYKIEDAKNKIKDIYDKMSKCFADVKRNNGKEMANEYYSIEAIDVNTKGGLDDLRSDIVQGFEESEAMVKRCVEEKKSTQDLLAKFNKLNRRLSAIQNTISKSNNPLMESLNTKLNTNSMYKFATDVRDLCASQYKLLQLQINSLFYANKIAYKVAMKYIKKWSKKEEESTD